MPLGSRHTPWKVDTTAWIGPALQDHAAGVDEHGQLFAGILLNNGPAVRVHNNPPGNQFPHEPVVNIDYDVDLTARIRSGHFHKAQGRLR